MLPADSHRFFNSDCAMRHAADAQRHVSDWVPSPIHPNDQSPRRKPHHDSEHRSTSLHNAAAETLTMPLKLVPFGWRTDARNRKLPACMKELQERSRILEYDAVNDNTHFWLTISGAVINTIALFAFIA